MTNEPRHAAEDETAVTAQPPMDTALQLALGLPPTPAGHPPTIFQQADDAVTRFAALHHVLPSQISPRTVVRIAITELSRRGRLADPPADAPAKPKLELEPLTPDTGATRARVRTVHIEQNDVCECGNTSFHSACNACGRWLYG